MSGKERNWLKTGDMKTRDRIWNYLQGRQTGKEANRLEKETLSDPFLYEALQGLEDVKGEHERIVGTLWDRMHKPVKRKKVASWIYRLALAAACLLVAGVALWLLYIPEKIAEPVRMVNLTDTVRVLQNQAKILENTRVRTEKQVEGRGSRVVKIMKNKPVIEEDTEVVETSVMEEQVQAVPRPTSRAAIPKTLMVRSMNSEKQVDGIVTDTDGHPLAGVSLFSEKLRKGVVTDQEGAFRLILPDSVSQLRASFIGMKSVVVPVPDSGKIHVILKNEPTALSENMVIGYGRMRKRMERRDRERGKTIRQSEFARYVTDSLRYPEDARFQKIEGNVVLSVHLNKRRHSMRIKVIGKLFPSCDREAIRLVEEFDGDWETDSRDFKVVVTFQLPLQP